MDLTDKVAALSSVDVCDATGVVEVAAVDRVGEEFEKDMPAESLGTTAIRTFRMTFRSNVSVGNLDN